MDTLYIVIPAYNEKENVEQVISDWYPVVEKIGGQSRLVVIDDGSKDNTYEIMTRLAKTKPLFTPLTKPNGGHGATVLYGYNYAIKNGADYVFQTDSDGQTNPAEFAAFWELRKQYDVILGNRTERGDGASRAFVEKVVCFLLRLYFGVNVPDANAPFRLMKANVLAKYIKKIPSDYNLPNIMLSTFFSHYGEKMTFRAITFKPRQGGVNSINIKRIVKIGWKALSDFRMFKKEMK